MSGIEDLESEKSKTEENKSKGLIEEVVNSSLKNGEVSLLADDVERAGGLGARDEIGSFLPVAMDSTDFEASLRDAKDFEEPLSNCDDRSKKVRGRIRIVDLIAPLA